MDVPFESFADLVYRLSHPPRPKSKNTGLSENLSPSTIFTSWLNHHRPLPPLFGKHLFRLLYPHEGSRRRYGLKESKFSRELEGILGLKGLMRWDGVAYEGQGGTGCLGKEVEGMMKDRIPKGQKSSMTISELDRLLDQLASLSPFSQLSQPGPSTLTLSNLLTKLYRESNLSPYALAVLTQIILRDLRPLMNPLPRLPTRNPTAMLRLKSNTGPVQLELHEAMRCWDSKMGKLYYGGKGDLDWCADTVEEINLSLGVKRIPSGPIVGVNVQIPKCRKGRSVDDALKPFYESRSGPSRSIWAETKYDGYRMQIHVKRSGEGEVDIRVFSKSKRDSTQARRNAHPIIRSALGLPPDPSLSPHPSLLSRSTTSSPPKRPMRDSIILETEIVPYNESSREGGRGAGIEEFWHLGSAGIDASETDKHRVGQRDQHRHLCIVFFDVLHLDGESLLQKCYDERRKILEGVVRTVPGFSILVDRVRIPLWKGLIVARNILEGVFRGNTEAREEGLVLKATESTYLDPRYPWVKLKKDYIPNLGDCIDLVVLGAGWDIDRARELRVDTSVITTFYIGVLTNRNKVKSRLETPHFEILFRASYGMDRSQLEVYNENIRLGRWRTKAFDKDDPLKRRLLGLSWTYHLPRSMSPPSVLFEQPLCAEVMGAGFQKVPFSNYYEIRWPRLQKIFPADERKWVEALDGSALISTARQALGYDLNPTPCPAAGVPATPTSPDDSVRQAWRSSTQGCLDVPDSNSNSSGSPYKLPRGTGRGMGIQSAPDVLKYSPPTPPPSSPTRPGLTVSIETRDRIYGISFNPLAPGGEYPSGSTSTSPSGSKDRSMKQKATTLASSIPDLYGTAQRPSPPANTLAVAPFAKRLLQPARIIAPVPSSCHATPPSAPISTSPSKPLATDIVMPAKGPSRKRKRLRPLSLRSRLKLARRDKRATPNGPRIT